MGPSQKEENNSFLSKFPWLSTLSSEKKIIGILVGLLFLVVAFLIIPSLFDLWFEKTMLWILCGLLILVGAFKNISSGSAMVIGLGVVVLTYALIDIQTIEKMTSKWISWERYEYSKEERQIAAQAGQKDIPPEIKQKLDQIVENAKRRKDEERAPEDYLVLANQAWDEKRYEDGFSLVYAGLNLNPKDSRTRADLYNVLGMIYYDLNSGPLSEENYRKAIQFDVKNNFAHNNLGILYADQKKYTKAEDAYKKALNLDPQFVDAHYNLGNLYADQKKYTKAEAAYQKALKLDSDSADVHYSLGNLYADQKEYTKAEDAYEKALKLNPNYVDAQHNLGVLYANQKKYTKAEDAYKKVLKLDSDSADAHYGLGNLYADQREYTKAEDAYKKALDLDPKLKEAQENLEELRKLRGGDEK